MDGLDIELDRTVLDEIGDPIVHLLRNAVDHGIEPPEERVAAGKPDEGARCAWRRAGSATPCRSPCPMTVGGMDVERIWAKACERGIVEPSQRDAYSDERRSCSSRACRASPRPRPPRRSRAAAWGWTSCAARSSTSAARSSSARRPGIGSEFVLTLPLTLAIIQALLVGVGRPGLRPAARVRRRGADARGGSHRDRRRQAGRRPARRHGRCRCTVSPSSSATRDDTAVMPAPRPSTSCSSRAAARCARCRSSS